MAVPEFAIYKNTRQDGFSSIAVVGYWRNTGEVLVNFAGGAPGSVQGVIQVNAQIPSGITVGNAVPVVVQVGTSNSQPGVTLAVSN